MLLSSNVRSLMPVALPLGAYLSVREDLFGASIWLVAGGAATEYDLVRSAKDLK